VLVKWAKLVLVTLELIWNFQNLIANIIHISIGSDEPILPHAAYESLLCMQYLFRTIARTGGFKEFDPTK